ncbi:hypothetical protein MLD56_16315 [Paenibacillus peoriae]|uniref:hypothetical protein n=1 Tax=Paenibacillus peoriae TaxID=59893 RepID=UPI001F144C23|nr:hypothetical protein [Paenibacillus peoriae]UMY53138.1 hypothetical protein MLD56_16315 [Paenibacillus peoriae]
MNYSKYFHKDVKVFQLRIRKNPNNLLGFPDGPLFPCHMFVENNGVIEYVSSPIKAKDSMIKDGSIITVVTLDRIYRLSRREISHIDGPFDYDITKTISTTEAANYVGKSEMEIQHDLKAENDQVSIVEMQKKYGAYSVIPKQKKQYYETVVRDIYRYHSRGNWIKNTCYLIDMPFHLQSVERYVRAERERLGLVNNA